MKNIPLRHLVFWALCCALGLFCKRLVSPFANVITDALHIPGGIGTSFSLMFLAVAAVLVPHLKGCTIMAAAQSGLALALGMVGSMGALSPVGYILPGIVMDIVFLCAPKLKLSPEDSMVVANALGAVCASLAANLIVFRLHGIVLLLYVCVSATSGAIFGMLGKRLIQKLRPVLKYQAQNRRRLYEKT